MNESNNKTIIKKKVPIIIIQLAVTIITILSLWSLGNLNKDAWYKYSSIIIVFNAIISLLNMKILGIRMRSLSVIFIMFTYLLHFGQVIIHGFFPIYVFQGFDFLEIISFDGLKNSVSYSLNIINITSVGIIFAFKSGNHTGTIYKESNSKNNEKLYQRIYNIGKYIFIICVPFFLYLSVESIMSSRQIGYVGGVNVFYGAGIISTLGYITFSGLYMMAYATDKKKTRNIILIIAIFLSLGAMMSGERGHQITFLVAMFALPMPTLLKNELKRVKRSIKMLYVVGIYLIISFLSTISTIRGKEIQSFNLVFTIWTKGLLQNPVMKLIEELGGTIYTVYLTIQKVPESIRPGFGSTYITSLFTAIPNISGLFTKINQSSHFVNRLNTSSLGGSYIGELYFNYLYYGIIVAFIIGIFISKISDWIISLNIKSNPIKLAISVQLFAYILWWSRDAFSSIIRPVFWCFGLVWFIQQLIIQRNSNLKYLDEKNSSRRNIHKR